MSGNEAAWQWHNVLCSTEAGPLSFALRAYSEGAEGTGRFLSELFAVQLSREHRSGTETHAWGNGGFKTSGNMVAFRHTLPTPEGMLGPAGWGCRETGKLIDT